MRRALQWLLIWFNFNEQRRRIDLQILWPACKENARDIDHARAAFAVHAFNDPAWASLGHDEIAKRISALV